jgi:hypothetical protein
MTEYARRSLPQDRRDEDTNRTTPRNSKIRKSILELTIFARARQSRGSAERQPSRQFSLSHLNMQGRLGVSENRVAVLNTISKAVEKGENILREKGLKAQLRAAMRTSS